MPVKYENSKLLALPTQWRNLIALHLNAANNNQVVVAKQLAPRDTNYMADVSTQIVKEATPEDLVAISVVGAFYGVYVEFGTVNMDAQPFWTPAFKLARAQLLNGLRSVMGRSQFSASAGVTTVTGEKWHDQGI